MKLPREIAVFVGAGLLLSGVVPMEALAGGPDVPRPPAVGEISPRVVEVAPKMRYSVDATPVSEFPVTLTEGKRVTFRTTEISDTEDPVLHLLDLKGNQVAVNDNGGGWRAAFLSYTPTSTATYRLLVRSRSTTSFGLCHLLMNNQLWRTNVGFAGAHLTLSGLRTGERLQTTVVPGGVDGPHSLYVLAADGISIIDRAVGIGQNSGASWSAPGAFASATVIIGSPQGKQGGRVRLVRNDAALPGHDPDRDGLGDELENVLGTCSARWGTRGGFECWRAADARDTDGDGISDGWEFFGRAVFGCMTRLGCLTTT